MTGMNVPAGLVHLHQPVESKVPLLDPQVLTAEQGGETAEEEEERILGGPAGGDLDTDGESLLGDKLNWKAAVKVCPFPFALSCISMCFLVLIQLVNRQKASS